MNNLNDRLQQCLYHTQRIQIYETYHLINFNTQKGIEIQKHSHDNIIHKLIFLNNYCANDFRVKEKEHSQ